MSRSTLLTAALVIVGVLAPGAGRSEDGLRADPVLGEMGSESYRAHCASCHGLDGRGEGPAAVALRTRPADLTRIAARRGGVFPEGEIARFIDGRFSLSAHGSREMPVWGTRFAEVVPEASLGEEIARGKIATLIEYLKSIQRSD